MGKRVEVLSHDACPAAVAQIGWFNLPPWLLVPLSLRLSAVRQFHVTRKAITTMPMPLRVFQLSVRLRFLLLLCFLLVCLLLANHAVVIITPPDIVVKSWLWSWSRPAALSLRLQCTHQSARATSDPASSKPQWMAPDKKGVKYLLFVGPGEQLTKARLHLAEAMALARLLNRTLVLPYVSNSFLSYAPPLPLPACTYFDVDHIADYVPWVTIEGFERWLRHRRWQFGTPPSIYTLYLGQASSCSKPAKDHQVQAVEMLYHPTLRGLFKGVKGTHETIECVLSDGRHESLLVAGGKRSTVDLLFMMKDSFDMFLESSVLEEAEAYLDYAPQLHREAERIISRHLSPDYVSIHWRVEWLDAYLRYRRDAGVVTLPVEEQTSLCADGLVREVREVVAAAVPMPSPASAPASEPLPCPSVSNPWQRLRGNDPESQGLREKAGAVDCIATDSNRQEPGPTAEGSPSGLCALAGDGEADSGLPDSVPLTVLAVDDGIWSFSHTQARAVTHAARPSTRLPPIPHCSPHVYLASDMSLGKAYTGLWRDRDNPAYKRGLLRALQALRPVTLAQMEGYDSLDTGQVGIIDKLVCMKGKVFLMASDDCGGYSSFSREIREKRKRFNMTTQVWSVESGKSVGKAVASLE